MTCISIARSRPAARGHTGGRWWVASVLSAVTLGLLAAAGGASAAAAELSAAEILDRVAGTGVLSGSGQARLELVTENRRGQQRAYRLQIYRAEGPDGSDRQLLEYLEPADVRGTKLLSLGQPDGEAQIWLYLPALGRERRVAGADVQQSFMGTDFTYEEIAGGATYKTDYASERLPDAELDGQPVYVVRLVPKDPSSRYGSVQMWIDQATFVPRRIDFYDKRGELEKRLSADDLRQGDDGGWMPHLITMANAKAQTRTIVRVLEYQPGQVPEEYFTVRYLRR
ncbi:outer membrane lipoprotein-sorting protein [Geochorda subterranea]|uniref:Outer membrane lipoprotein-sorting protein n=1 Tax=Geochorda subterranea TaxID=3109564 RepID=A0ABZ1BNB6_9FIRM|nr:outer membrane lipoprotein-sorting protein [Limnochorda sp. LNt]WRP14292.1 outer membrane lipoprotein-sorting protein [Limnochorda sp. LNt]